MLVRGFFLILWPFKLKEVWGVNFTIFDLFELSHPFSNKISFFFMLGTQYHFCLELKAR